MSLDTIKNLYKKNTTGNNRLLGESIIANDLIISCIHQLEEGYLCISARILSHNFFSEYSCKIEMDLNKKLLISTACTCDKYLKQSDKKINYACEHIEAAFNYFLNEARSIKSLTEDKIIESESNIIDYLAVTSGFRDLKLEVNINRNTWNNKLSFDFKIGYKEASSNKLYVIKDIEQFIIALYNKIPIEYGKDFIFDITKQQFLYPYSSVIEIIETINEIQSLEGKFIKKQDRLINGKSLVVPNYLLRDFFDSLANVKTYLKEGFYERPIVCTIIKEIPPKGFNLSDDGKYIILEIVDGAPVSLDDKGEIYLIGDIVYIVPKERVLDTKIIYDLFKGNNLINISKTRENEVLMKLIPDIQRVSKELNLEETIKQKILQGPAQYKFYLDKVDGEVFIKLTATYEGVEFNVFHNLNDKVVFRDIQEEKNIISRLKALGLENKDDKFLFINSDEYIFNFLKNDINKLQEIGEVYYSENFKGIKSIGNNSIIGQIKRSNHNYFEFEFEIKDISQNELEGILKAFRDKLRYYKLENGEFIDLEQIEIERLLQLLNVMTRDNDNITTCKFNDNRVMYINDYIQKEEIDYISLDEEFNYVVDKFANVNEMEIEVPNSLNAKLRDYQVVGYKWFKVMSSLGFGGILGDEMGLGKTLQAITFLLSEKNKRVIIVTPTSLIYNWKNEFEKFAPTLEVTVLVGDRQSRIDLLEQLNKHNIIITTYNLLRRDFEYYEDILFDYCIIDEAQNIKNHNSESAKVIKKIQATTRFALTGTPIENSLMELWSIFDFILPGYLKDANTFNVRYHRKLNEDKVILDEISRLIKPFILRRLKEEVIKELPDKIEKKIVVPMTDEQNKVYSIYAKNALDIIEKKVKDREFSKSKIEILSYITKLRQLALEPSLLVDDYRGGSGKINALMEIITASIEEGHRILVFSQFTSALKIIGEKFTSSGISYSYLDGSIDSKRRITLVEEFNKGINDVFLISLKAGGVGLNLTTADIVIHFDPWWNPAVENQATDRAHRFGQKNVVEVIKLISKGTLEEKIIEMQEGKLNLINNILENNNGNVDITELTEDEVRELFTRGI